MNKIILNVLIGVCISVPAMVITLKKNALTVPAAILAAVYVIAMCVMSKWAEAVFLIGMYFIVFGVDLLSEKKKQKKAVGLQGGKRNALQIFANGSVGIILLICNILTGKTGFVIAYYAVIFEVLTDSVASDVGMLSEKAPWDILTWKKVPCGLSGGVSFLGLGAGAVACLVAGITASVANHWEAREFVAVIAVAYAGMLLDSMLGSGLQVKFQCANCGAYTEQTLHCGQKTIYARGVPFFTNSVINFICTIVTGIAACMIIL